jgi:hypothetical protein
MVLLELSVLTEDTSKDKDKICCAVISINVIIRRLTLENHSGEYLDGTYCRDKYTRT